MWKKGKDKKVSAAATSSAQHSCRKKCQCNDDTHSIDDVRLFGCSRANFLFLLLVPDCGACLTKFYNERAPSKRGPTNSEFVCPACRGICCCAACRRIKARQLGEIDPSALSPASMLAYSYVYCPDVLLSSMGETEEAAPEELEPPSDHDQSATMEDVKPAAPSLQSYYYDASQVYANNIAAAMHGGGKGKGKHGLIKLEQPSAQA
jgi:hypothetical protein